MFVVSPTFLHLLNSTVHTSPIFKNLRLLKIYDIHTLQQLKFYYKMVHTNLPIYFNTLPLIRNQDIHGHNTRCRNKIGTIRTKHEFAKRCIRYSLAHTIKGKAKDKCPKKTGSKTSYS